MRKLKILTELTDLEKFWLDKNHPIVLKTYNNNTANAQTQLCLWW